MDEMISLAYETTRIESALTIFPPSKKTFNFIAYVFKITKHVDIPDQCRNTEAALHTIVLKAWLFC